MEIKVKRITPIDYPYTIGKMYIDGDYFCDTLEDTDRGLSQDMSEEEIKSKKVYGQTAIPTGRYKILMNVVSPKFSKKQFYMDVCQGRVPRLEGVKAFSGILLHCAATADNVEGKPAFRNTAVHQIAHHAVQQSHREHERDILQDAGKTALN